jgi:putative glutamine amidotransferase
MIQRPLILVSPNVERRGSEFGDLSVSVSNAYQQALVQAGALPMILPATASPEIVTECVRRADGVLLTGGEDVEPRLYTRRLPPRTRRTVTVTPDGGQRDLRELLVIKALFDLSKPLLAICRGHQMLNVALGGTLVADIRAEVPGAANHQRLDRKDQVVHQVRLTAGCFLAKIVGKQTLGVNSTHHQAVGRVAGPLQVTAVSPDGVIEGLELRPGATCGLPWLVSVQFHPERLARRYAEHGAVFRAFTQACVRNRKKNL